MRALWLIDGSYLYKSVKKFQKDNNKYQNKGIDYKKLKTKIQEYFKIDDIDSFYFNSTPDPATDAQNQYHTWLKSAEPKGPNIRVKLYDLKDKSIDCNYCNHKITVKVQKGVDVGIATTALKIYHKYNAIILSAGDGDFEDFVQFLVEDKDLKLFIAGFDGNISPDIQQYSSMIYMLNEHYDEICDTRNIKPFDTVDEVSEV